MSTMKTKPKLRARRMWANYYPAEDGCVCLHRTRTRANSMADGSCSHAAIPVAVIPLDDPMIGPALGNGSCCAPDVSLDFLQSIPNEVAGVVANLRAEVERLTKQRDNLLKPMRDQAIARAERAEAILGKLQELHGCSQEMVAHWCEHAAQRSCGLDRVKAELAREREKVRLLRCACESICEEWGRNYDAAPIFAGQRMATCASEALEKVEEAT